MKFTKCNKERIEWNKERTELRKYIGNLKKIYDEKVKEIEKL